MQAEADAFGSLKGLIEHLSSGQLPFERAVLLLRSQQFGEMFQKVRSVAAFWKNERQRAADGAFSHVVVDD